MSFFHLTLVSGNSKTGPIPVSTTSADTCPPTCPFQGSGCYAEQGHVGMHWRKVTKGARGAAWRTFLAAVRTITDGQLWRHNQAGDLPGAGNRIAVKQLRELVDASKHSRPFTYTHKPVLGTSALATSNREAVAAANRDGFVINLSGNNLRHADELADLGIGPVVTVLPSDAPPVTYTPKGRRVIGCPAQTRDDVTCSTCQLCAKRDRRGIIVGFFAHGSSHRKASAIAAG